MRDSRNDRNCVVYQNEMMKLWEKKITDIYFDFSYDSSEYKIYIVILQLNERCGVGQFFFFSFQLERCYYDIYSSKHSVNCRIHLSPQNIKSDLDPCKVCVGVCMWVQYRFNLYLGQQAQLKWHKWLN